MRFSRYQAGTEWFSNCSASCSHPVVTASSEGGIHPGEDLLVLEPKTETKRPPFYKVVMLNDDYTPMDFVVEVLKNVFRKNHHDAINIMLEIHHQGAGLCGVYTRDVAETKIQIVIELARNQEYPLQCVMEQE
jgi:ATP-dependent Clp protease adaptor protein ClpS